MPYPNRSVVVVVGTPLVIDCRNRMFDHAISFICQCGVGGTMVAEISNSPTAVDDPNGASTIWAASGAGTMTDAAPQEIVRYAACAAIRFSATGANGVVEQKG